MRRFVAAGLLLTLAAIAAAADRPLLRVDPDRYLPHLKFLASDELGGRGNGTPGLERAAEYIAAEFRKASLEPGGEGASYFQSFDITARVEPDPRSTLIVRSAAGSTVFKLGLHYHPLSAMDAPADSRGTARVPQHFPIVFAGYGISAPGLDYDDYEGIDVQGAAVVVFTHEPQEQDPNSRFEGTALTPFSDVAHKAAEARRRGARLLIIVEDPLHFTDRALMTGWANDPQIDALEIPVLRVDRARLSRALGHVDFTAVARRIDALGTPRSTAVGAATASYSESFAIIRPRVRNVTAIVRGVDPSLSSEAVVIGGHYDHLGLGGRFSNAPASAADIHNGADDNASGTAAIIEMARVAAQHRARFKRSLVFVAFAAEEIGLLGSRQYVAHPKLPLGRTKAMINLDMIGRARGRVMVGGTERVAWLKTLVDGLRPETRLRLLDFTDGYEDGASDDASFLRHGVPVIAFFTGFHDDYHRPTDDWPLIDPDGAAEIATLALRLAERIANR